ncbi:hypothetical protein [Absidia glauca]|uniref:Uncharacterized protein n=1 Tax=Absidia glauca TaxID=4829 RepID=A0A163JUZ1_ABSGL|nr:hypothetical protein [Absidia glauca]
MISYLGRFVTLAAGFAFLYSGYLAYKRSFKPYKRLLYLFMANLVFDAYNLVWGIKLVFDSTIDKVSIQTNISKSMMETSNATNSAFYNSTLYNSTMYNNTMYNTTLYNTTLYNSTEISNGTMSNSTFTQKDADMVAGVIATGIHIFVPFFTCLFFLVPFFNKLYLVSRIDTYTKYVIYKKEEAQIPAMQLPHKLPECSQ